MLCFVCGADHGKLQHFKEETLAKCSESLLSRKHFNLKYSECYSENIMVGWRIGIGSHYNGFCADQNRPVDFRKELKNTSFKESLVSFLIDHWSTEDVKQIIGHRKIYISYKKCYMFTVVNDTVKCEVAKDFQCSGHEEADTKVIFILHQLNTAYNVVLQCSDTDILVLTLGNIADLNKDTEVWILFGTGNNRRYINVRKIHDKLGNKICKALPGFHAMTGCDFNPAFYKLGKARPWNMLLKNEKVQDAFINSNDKVDDYDAVLKILEEFTCQLYSTKSNGLDKCVYVNEARQRLFEQNYCSKNTQEAFEKKFKNFDPSIIPPCQSELRQHLLRTIYINKLWSNATQSNPISLDPQNYGWILTDSGYTFHWFDGEQFPKEIADILEEEDSTRETDSDLEDCQVEEDGQYDQDTSDDDTDEDDETDDESLYTEMIEDDNSDDDDEDWEIDDEDSADDDEDFEDEDQDEDQ